MHNNKLKGENDVVYNREGKEKDMIEVYIDGSSRGSGSRDISGAGIFIKNDGTIYEYIVPLPEMTNHEAEFHAVIEALNICRKKFPNEIISCHSDSRLVVDAIDKTYVKNERYKQLLATIMEKAAIFPYFFIKWIPSNQNKHADQLAKRAIYEQLNEKA